MASLLDIAPLTGTVHIRGIDITVTGLPLKDVAQLLVRFPKLQQALKGASVVENVMASGPEAIAAIIAAGCGAPAGLARAFRSGG